MKRKIALIAGVFGLVVIAVALWVWRQNRPAPRAAQILPASTLVFLDVPAWPAARAGLTNTQAYALLQEPEIQALLAEPLRWAATALGAKPEQLEEDFGKFLGQIEGEFFVALPRINLLPLPKPSLVFGADLGGNLLKVMGGLAYQERSLRKYNPKASFGSASHQGQKYAYWRFAPQRELYHTFLGTMIVFATDQPSIHQVIDQWQNRNAAEKPALAANPTYQQFRSGLPADAAFVSFVNIEQIMQLVGPLLLLSGQGGSSLEKLARLRATGLATRFLDRQFVDTGYTLYKTAATNVPLPSARGSLPFTSPDTLLYMVQSLDWASGYQEALDGMAGNPRFAKIAMQFERSLRRQGLNPRTDFFQHLGPETAVLGNWREGARFPELAVLVQWRDASATNRLDEVMQALKQSLLVGAEAPDWERGSIDGRVYQTLRLGASGLAPTYLVHDRFLVIASNPDYVRLLVRNPNGSLAASLGTGLPVNAHEYFYCDLPRLLLPIHGAIRANLTDTAARLPAVETWQRHLSSYRSATVTQPDSELTTTISPMGKPLTVVAGLAGLAMVAQPYLPPLGALLKSVPPDAATPPTQ